MIDIAQNEKKRYTIRHQLSLYLISLIAGILIGCAAVIFRFMVQFIHNVLFYDVYSFTKDISAAYGAHSRLGYLVIVFTALGGIIVTYLISRFAPDAEGHGIPEVIEAIYYRNGHIRGIAGFVKALASSLSIGTGAPVGREGPVAQVAASIGSVLADIGHLRTWERITLVAGGAAAGIAASFNTPFGGVLLAMELLLPEISVRVFFPVMLMTGSATYVSSLVFGIKGVFSIPSINVFDVDKISWSSWVSLIVLGICAGFISLLFIKTLDACEVYVPKIFKNKYLRSFVSFILVGCMLYALSVVFGYYYISDGGFSYIGALLNHQISVVHTVNWEAIGFLLCIIFFQILGACLSIGGGASGGVFSPSLTVGVSLGYLFGIIVHYIHPSLDISLQEYGALGMAAVLGGTTSAVLSAVILVLEMTRTYSIMIPLIVVVPIALSVRFAFTKDGVYTLKFTHTERRLPQERRSSLHLTHLAKNVLTSSFVVHDANTSLSAFYKEKVDKETGKSTNPDFLLIKKDHHILGLTSIDKITESMVHQNFLSSEKNSGNTYSTDTDTDNVVNDPEEELSDHNILAFRMEDFVVVRASEVMQDVLYRMSHFKLRYAIVIAQNASHLWNEKDVLGIIGPQQIANTLLKTHNILEDEEKWKTRKNDNKSDYV